MLFKNKDANDSSIPVIFQWLTYLRGTFTVAIFKALKMKVCSSFWHCNDVVIFKCQAAFGAVLSLIWLLGGRLNTRHYKVRSKLCTASKKLLDNWAPNNSSKNLPNLLFHIRQGAERGLDTRLHNKTKHAVNKNWVHLKEVRSISSNWFY